MNFINNNSLIVNRSYSWKTLRIIITIYEFNYCKVLTECSCLFAIYLPFSLCHMSHVVVKVLLSVTCIFSEVPSHHLRKDFILVPINQFLIHFTHLLFPVLSLFFIPC